MPLLGSAQPPLSAVSSSIAPVKPNTVVFKLKPQSTYILRQAAGQQLEKMIAELQPKSYKQKFPRAKSRPALQPGEVDLTLIYELEYQAGLSFEKVKKRLLASGLTDYVEPVYLPNPLLQPNDPYADSAIINLSQANQYYLKVIKAYRAWNLAPGDSSMVIGILDTGVRFYHEDLKNNISYNYADPVDGRDNDQDGYIDNFRGWDLADNDNNPIADGNSHGVYVSGVSSALPNNGKGLAGTGFKSRFLPLKVFASTAKGSFAGYEAIVYAADHGCQVINLSWGVANHRSAYEQDIINYAAINKNVVIVAAAGNTAGERDFYPASYDNVISVAASDDKDQCASFFSNSPFIDLLAPGIRLWTTGNGADNNYTFGTGTSFAAPVVAGAAALVRQRFPQYTALQVAEQLRMTADPVYHIPANAVFPERLGRGRLNLYRAVTETQVQSVRNTANQINAGNPVYPGDTLRIVATFKNVLAPVADLQVSLTSTSPYITIVKGSHKIGSLGGQASHTNAHAPFLVYVHPNIPANTVVSFRYGFASGHYQDYQYFKVPINPDYLTVDINNLAVTVTSKGNIGYNGFHYEQGEGVVFKSGKSLLSEGGFMIGASASLVSDNIRNERSRSNQKFYSLRPVRQELPPVFGEQSASGMMQDSFPGAGTVGVKVSYRAMAWQQPPDHNFVMLEYKITNNSTAPLSNLYAGLFSDWDIGAPNRNAAAWDSANAMGYVYLVDKASQYAGVKLLTPVSPTHYAIDNGYGPFGNISLADGFTAAEKYRALSNPPQNNQAAGLKGNDVSDVVGGRLPDLAPGQSFMLAFALVAGDNLGELQASARAAQNRYRQLKTGMPPIALNDTICRNSSATIRPGGGSRFNFYADAAGGSLLGSGASFTTPALKATTTYFISNTDSLHESTLVPVKIVVQPIAAFSFSPNPVPAAAGGQVRFTAQTAEAVSWHWDFGDHNIANGPDPIHRYHKPGTYQVRLITTDKKGCSDTLTQSISVKVVRYNRQWRPEDFRIYPNPSPQSAVTVVIPGDIDVTSGITLEVVNAIGKTLQKHQVTQAGHTLLPLPELSNGMYLLRISGSDGQISKRFQLLQ